MYNAKGYLVENPSNRYILRPDSTGLRKNSDGSVTLYLQADEPARDRAANWLPAPRGIFIVTLRTICRSRRFLPARVPARHRAGEIA
jgi:hypothetical protein